MMTSFLQPGCTCSFQYPRHNFRQLPMKTELRRIKVSAIRDTLGEPLDQMTITLNPQLKRGRWIVTGLDLDKNGERSFYVESMTSIQPLSDAELHPLNGVEYVVLERNRVAFHCQSLADALAFQSRQQSGTVCGVLCHASREMNKASSDDEEILAEFRKWTTECALH